MADETPDYDPLMAKAKVAVRTQTTDTGLLDELNDLILAGRADLKRNGIVDDTFAENNQVLVSMAVKLYVKAHWGYDNPDAATFLELYNALKTELSIHSQFGVDDEGSDADAVQ